MAFLYRINGLLGVMGLMMTYMMQMQANNQRQFRLLNDQVEEMNFLRRVRQLFESENTCTATFGSYCRKTRIDRTMFFTLLDCDSPRKWVSNNMLGTDPRFLKKRDLNSLLEGSSIFPFRNQT